jgi:hypothetical protein
MNRLGDLRIHAGLLHPGAALRRPQAPAAPCRTRQRPSMCGSRRAPTTISPARKCAPASTNWLRHVATSRPAAEDGRGTCADRCEWERADRADAGVAPVEAPVRPAFRIPGRRSPRSRMGQGVSSTSRWRTRLPRGGGLLDRNGRCGRGGKRAHGHRGRQSGRRGPTARSTNRRRLGTLRFPGRPVRTAE